MERTDSTWSRHSYPVQSLQDGWSHQTNGASSPVGSAKRLPATMRAVRNADGYSCHGKTIIILLDGTGDKFDADNSNIVHLISCMKKDDPTQVTYYQSGIGTYGSGGLSNGVAAGFDMAIGSGLGVHIRDAYTFIMQVYNEGDKICLFGFSRGAYTARCLAGMLHKVGLLPAHNKAQIPFAYQFYKDESDEGWAMSLDFKQTFCQDISVYFLGLFDSVASVGFIPRKLPLSSTPANQPSFFRHAMSLDEHRSKFKSLPFRHAVTQGERDAETIFSATSAVGANSKVSNGAAAGPKSKAALAGNYSEHAEMVKTNVLEVWFAGCHADVGGGAVKNEVRHKLSQIPLRWLIRQCFDCDTGIIFYTKSLAEMGLDVHTLWPTYRALPKPSVGPSPKLMEKYEAGTIDPIKRRAAHLDILPEQKELENEKVELHEHEAARPKAVGEWTPEHVEDFFDSMAPINDQLIQAKGWWVLEAWPIKVRLPDLSAPDGWRKKVSINRGRFRPVLQKEPNLHWTVKRRMDDLHYKIRARTNRAIVWKEVV